MGRAALTVLDVMAELTPQATVRLKYPNDVQVRDEQGWSKIAGILVENEFIGFVCQSTVVGIGLNVFEEQELDTISQRCTSLHRYGTIQDVETVRRSIRDRFSAWILAETPVVFERWETELVKHHSIVRIAGEDELWTVQHLLSDGKLSLTNANQTRQRVVSDGDSLQYLD
jgi:biotin-(acetyl-CoA carboxylase) ligase